MSTANRARMKSGRSEGTDVFAWTLTLLAYLGTDIRSRKTNAFYTFCKYWQVVMVITSIGVLASSWFYKLTHWPNYAAMASTISGLAGHLALKKHGKDIIRTMDTLLLAVDDECKNKFKKCDRGTAVTVVIKLMLMSLYGFVMPFGVKSHDYAKLMVSYELPPDFKGYLLESVHVLSLFYFMCLSVSAAFFYVCAFCVLQYHAYAIAKCAERAASNPEPVKGQLVGICRSLYKAHWTAKNNFNDTIGIIPFSLFGSLFFVFTTGISYVVIMKMKFELFFFITFIVGCTLYFILLAYYVAWHASKSTAAMSQALAAIGELTSRYDMDCSEDTRRQCEGLHRLTLSHGLQPGETGDSAIKVIIVSFCFSASAWRAFNIDCSILLTFPNALVPFTIMIITSAAEFRDGGEMHAARNVTL